MMLLYFFVLGWRFVYRRVGDIYGFCFGVGFGRLVCCF